jgi:hypothetical protein
MEQKLKQVWGCAKLEWVNRINVTHLQVEQLATHMNVLLIKVWLLNWTFYAYRVPTTPKDPDAILGCSQMSPNKIFFSMYHICFTYNTHKDQYNLKYSKWTNGTYIVGIVVHFSELERFRRYTSLVYLLNFQVHNKEWLCQLCLYHYSILNIEFVLVSVNIICENIWYISAKVYIWTLDYILKWHHIHW